MNAQLVMGLGGTVDYEVTWDASVLERLVEQYGIGADELSTSAPVDSERSLVAALLAFVRDGVGGEKFVASSDIVEEFASRFERRITLGGTCVRGAAAMGIFGLTCVLHLVSIDDHVRRLLPAGCTYLCSADHDTTDPHLIVQFPEGARVRVGDVELVAPHPNRVILVNDPPNRELLLSDRLGDALATADVFMISGFNVMQDADLLGQRLTSLVEHMRRLPPRAVVLFEDAGYHVPALSSMVRDALLDRIDVYSMNEEEMQAYVGRRVDLLDAADVGAALRSLAGEITARTLVVHTKYWSVALGARVRSYEAALQGGIVMASTRYRLGDDYTASDYEETSRLPVHARGLEVATELTARFGDRVCCLPALVVPVDHPTTIGLGDTFVGGFVAGLARSGEPGTGSRSPRADMEDLT